MSRATHGGGVVFKLTRDGPCYLLVEASGTRGRWVFPKGHVEKGETPAETALREVAEEAGVRARPVRRLRRVKQKQEGDSISIAYFLMIYTGRTRPLEKRRVRWLAYDDAIEALDLAKSKRLLRSADRTAARLADKNLLGMLRKFLARFYRAGRRLRKIAVPRRARKR